MSKITCRTENLLTQELVGEMMIYDLSVDKAFCLNETLAEVWNSCDGTKSADEIRANLSGKFSAEISPEFVYLSLKQLDDHNLLNGFDESLFDSRTMSRRSLVKKAGLASAIALPIISAVVAPHPANAASETCSALIEACSSSAPCCPGLICNGGGFCSFV